MAMLKSDLLPPRTGPNADPVLYGVAAVLAELFPLVRTHGGLAEPDATGERDDERETRESD